MNTVREDDAQALVLTKRFEDIDQRRSRPRWRWMLYVLIAILSLVVLSKIIYIASSTAVYMDTGGRNKLTKYLVTEAKKRFRKNFNAEQKLILYGDASRKIQSEQIKGLWDSDPENPVFFSEYVRVYLSENDKLPPNFLETAEKIDPDNAWFLYLAASAEAQGSVEKNKITSSQKAKEGARTFTIIDQVKFERSIVLIKKGAAKPYCKSYTHDLFQQRVKLLPNSKREDITYSLIYVLGSTHSDIYRFRYATDVLGAYSLDLSKKNETLKFQNHIATSDAILRHFGNYESSNLLESLVIKSLTAAISRDLSTAAKSMNLTNKSERFSKIDEKIKADKEERKAKHKSEDIEINIESKSGLLAGLVIPGVSNQVANPPKINDELLKPGRLADHELASILCAIISCILLIMAMLFVGIIHFRSSTMVRKLSSRIVRALTWKDWAWLIGAGVILPFIYVLVVNRFTPLGGRDFSLRHTKFLLPSVYYTGLVRLIMCTLLILGRWRLKSILSPFGFPVRSTCLSWCVLISCLVSMPLIGFAAIQDSRSLMIIGGILFVLADVWLVIKGFQIVIGKSEMLMYRGVIARIFIPAFAVAMICLLTSIFYLERSEQYWLNKDTIIRMDATRKEGPNFEYTIAKQLEKETRAIINGDF